MFSSFEWLLTFLASPASGKMNLENKCSSRGVGLHIGPAALNPVPGGHCHAWMTGGGLGSLILWSLSPCALPSPAGWQRPLLPTALSKPDPGAWGQWDPTASWSLGTKSSQRRGTRASLLYLSWDSATRALSLCVTITHLLSPRTSRSPLWSPLWSLPTLCRVRRAWEGLCVRG